MKLLVCLLTVGSFLFPSNNCNEYSHSFHDFGHSATLSDKAGIAPDPPVSVQCCDYNSVSQDPVRPGRCPNIDGITFPYRCPPPCTNECKKDADCQRDPKSKCCCTKCGYRCLKPVFPVPEPEPFPQTTA